MSLAPELFGRIQGFIPAAAMYPRVPLDEILQERSYIPIKNLVIQLDNRYMLGITVKANEIITSAKIYDIFRDLPELSTNPSEFDSDKLVELQISYYQVLLKYLEVEELVDRRQVMGYDPEDFTKHVLESDDNLTKYTLMFNYPMNGANETAMTKHSNNIDDPFFSKYFNELDDAILTFQRR